MEEEERRGWRRTAVEGKACGEEKKKKKSSFGSRTGMGKRGGNVDETRVWAVSWWGGKRGNMLPEAGSHANYNFNSKLLWFLFVLGFGFVFVFLKKI